MKKQFLWKTNAYMREYNYEIDWTKMSPIFLGLFHELRKYYKCQEASNIINF